MSIQHPATWCLILILVCSRSKPSDGQTHVPHDAFGPALTTLTGPFPETFPLITNWRFRADDQPEFARHSFNDTSWVELDSLGTLLLPETHGRLGWEGIGWFRLHLKVHRDLLGKQLALVALQSGAAEFYLDGKLLQSVGMVGSSTATERAEYTLSRGAFILFRFESGSQDHVISVRYSNHWAIEDLPAAEFQVGFRMGLAEPEAAIEPWLVALRSFSIQQALAVMPLGFAILHFLVFLFYRELRGNLYYALFALSVAVMIYVPLHGVTAGDPVTHYYHNLLFKISIVTTVLFGLRFLYGELLDSTPRFYRIEVVVGLAMLLLISVVDQAIYFYYFVLAFFPEVIRILYTGVRRQVPGSRIIGLGWIVFSAACVFQSLIELEYVEFEFVWFPYIVGILALLVFMSAHLARAVALTNRDLEAQLVQVKRLSEQALAQERHAREEAVAREHLEAENALKTTQLEAAHERQKVLDELEKTNVELQHTQAELVQSAKMAALGKLVAGITHEINTPVGAIRSTVDTLRRAAAKLKEMIGASARDTAAGADRAFDAIAQSNRVIGEAVERITGIVSNLRSFARLDEAEFQVADLEEGLDSTLAVMGAQVSESVSIAKDYAGIDQVYCSPAQLNNVFMHLVTNAIQAMHGEGQITLSTFQDDDRVHVRIGDTGPGIAPDQLEHIFDFNFRAGQSRMKMGLGLVADYNIVQAHEGELTVENQEHSGAQVTVSLPRRGDESTKPPSSS